MESLCVTYDDIEDVMKFLENLYWGDKENSPFKVDVSVVSNRFEVFVSDSDYAEESTVEAKTEAK
jgi:hypothetical protein